MPTVPDQPSPPSLRQRRKAETRQLVLEAAKALFAELGFAQTTIRVVARRAGVGLGTVMSHFPDKNALLSAALLTDWNATLVQAMASLSPDQSWRDQLLHLCGAFFGYYAQQPSLSRALLREQLFNTQAWTTELAGLENQSLAMTAQVLAQAQAAGQIRAGVDCRQAAEALFALYQYVVYTGLAQDPPEPQAMRERLGGLTDLLLTGLAGSGA